MILISFIKLSCFILALSLNYSFLSIDDQNLASLNLLMFVCVEYSCVVKSWNSLGDTVASFLSLRMPYIHCYVVPIY